ncbi:transforming growth factor beta activator LRRC32-like [Aplochiton taeniatus]
MFAFTFCTLLLLVWLFGFLCKVNGIYHDPKVQLWQNQNLTLVPIGLDTNLRELDLSNNFLGQLRTLYLPYLEKLDLSYNQLDLISEGAVKNLARLEELNLDRNALNSNIEINSKALQTIIKLRNLDLSRNNLNDDAVELYLQNKPYLEHLKLTGNGLTKLTSRLFTGTKCLKTICMENNLITDIERGAFDTLGKLNTINLSRNNLVHICDFKLHQVKYLNLSRNSIEFFVANEDEKQFELEILDLSFNNLIYFPIVPKINNLRYLHLQNNRMGSLDADVLISEAYSLYTQIAKGENNAVGTTEINNPYSNWRLMPLIYIDLSSNHFRYFPLEMLSYLTSLETLNLSYNCLQEIGNHVTQDSQMSYSHQFSFTSLRNFDLQYNNIEYISPIFLEAIPKIETLNLQNNHVRPCAPPKQSNRSELMQMNTTNDSPCVSFENMRTLRHLNLRENGITVLHSDTFRLTSLVSLNLARNPGMVMKVDALEDVQRSLQLLSISEMNMTNAGLFLPCIPTLTELNISNNHLNVFPESFGCIPLKKLDVRNNNFVTFDSLLIGNISLHLDVMHISGNLLNCCDTTWLTILNEANVTIPDLDQSQCISHVSTILLPDYLQNPSANIDVQNFLKSPSPATPQDYDVIVTSLDLKCNTIEKLTTALINSSTDTQLFLKACDVHKDLANPLALCKDKRMMVSDVLKFGPMLQSVLMAASIGNAVQVLGATLSLQQLKLFFTDQNKIRSMEIPFLQNKLLSEMEIQAPVFKVKGIESSGSLVYTCMIATKTELWKGSGFFADQKCIPDIGTYVMGWFAKQESWCRAQVTKICGISGDKNTPESHRSVSNFEVEVRRLDYGDTACLSLWNIKELSQELTVLPLQAIKVSLAHVTPVDGSSWSEEAVGWFRDIVQNRTLYARLYPQGAKVMVELFLEKGKMGAMR